MKYIKDCHQLNKNDLLNILWFNLARLESLKTDFRSRVGAVVVRKGKVVSIGRNHPHKTHPLMKKYHEHKTIHAEVDCIIGTDRDLLKGSVMYVYRELRDGTVAIAKPCEVCQLILKDIGIKKVYYTTNDGFEVYRL